jgi:hypothetical protein
MKKTYQIQERMWLYPGKSSWHFITIPQETAKEIDFYFEGCLKISANVKALAMWAEFMASFAWLPLLGKDKMFQVKFTAQLISVRWNYRPMANQCSSAVPVNPD